MKLRKTQIIALLIVAASFGLGWYLYPQLPEKTASHWNAAGQVNGYMGKLWGTILFPLISLGLWVLFLIIPVIDPKRENIAVFRKYYDRFLVVFFLFLFYIYSLTLIWNLGFHFELVQYLVPGLAVLFYAVGDLVGHALPNWFIGIRTPWTLSSKTVWEKTHRLGGKLFKAAAITSLIGILFPKIAFWFVVGPILAVALGLVVYSYREYAREQANRKG
jgi:uncharacterized membrane protein